MPGAGAGSFHERDRAKRGEVGEEQLQAERAKREARPSPIPSLCTHLTRAGIEWRRCHRASLTWRGHTKRPATRAGRALDIAVRLEYRRLWSTGADNTPPGPSLQYKRVLEYLSRYGTR